MRTGAPCRAGLAAAMVRVAPSRAHRLLATSLHRALRSGDTGSAFSIVRNALRRMDLRAEKVVSHRFGFVWICVPKVASRSLIAALCEVDPAAELMEERTLAELYAAQRRTRGYRTVAFVRCPYTRTHSFHVNKVLRLHGIEERSVIADYHKISVHSSFGEVCAWLNTPYGADALADRHWLSQHRQILLPNGRLPDFVGRYERLAEDLGDVAARLGMPGPRLPVLNTNTGWHPNRELAETERQRRMADLSVRNRTLLRERYAADFRLFGYRT